MSIQSVAHQAGVSVATVSRVFNLPDKVSAETRERVIAVARQLGYLPNASARTLRTRHSRVLGVLLPTLLNPVFAECLQGIAQAAVDSGYAIIPMTSGYRVDDEDHAVHALLAGNVDGLILVVSDPGRSAALQRLQQAGLPYVLAYNRHADHPCIAVDNEAAAAQAVARLAGLGHTRIAMVSGTLAASDRAQQRVRGYRQGMADAGLPAPAVVEVPFVETAVDALAAFLQQTPRPTALICSNDLLAIRSIRAAHLGGLRVPQDLTVVGFDDTALATTIWPALTTVHQPITDMAGEAARLLQRQIRRQRDGAPLKPEHLLMNFSLIRRQSDAAPRVRPPAHFLPPQAPRPVDAEMASTTPPSA